MDENSLVLPMKPSRAVLQLSPAKAVTPDLPHYGTHCAKEQNSEVAHTSAITDISLVEVCNLNLCLIHRSISVQVSVAVVTFLVS
jgi:hypothetical protein